MASDPSTYEIKTPDSVAAPATELAMGRHSGRHSLEARYAALGYALTPEQLDEVARDFAALANRKETVLDEDLISILHHGVLDDVHEEYTMESLDVRCGSGMSTAEVVLASPDDPVMKGQGSGDGPIAAAFAAMEGLLDYRVVLQDLTIRSVTPGRDALGEVSIHASVDGQTFTGRGAHTDVVVASAKAYLHAVNKAAAARVLEESHLASTADAWGV